MVDSGETKLTLEDIMRAAFQAILRGDTAERDRLCAMAERAFVKAGVESLPTDHDVMTITGSQH